MELHGLNGLALPLTDNPIIELMLAHVRKDKVEGAYNRALHLDRKTELAQIWADVLLEGAMACPADT